ncbi:hypothetical protein AKJ16_DCAP16906, partial [Drosera capensis]
MIDDRGWGLGACGDDHWRCLPCDLLSWWGLSIDQCGSAMAMSMTSLSIGVGSTAIATATAAVRCGAVRSDLILSVGAAVTVAASPGGISDDPVVEEKKVETNQKEESDDDMGFSLYDLDTMASGFYFASEARLDKFCLEAAPIASGPATADPAAIVAMAPGQAK